jgi:hypothetical protein
VVSGRGVGDGAECSSATDEPHMLPKKRNT